MTHRAELQATVGEINYQLHSEVSIVTKDISLQQLHRCLRNKQIAFIMVIWMASATP